MTSWSVIRACASNSFPVNELDINVCMKKRNVFIIIVDFLLLYIWMKTATLQYSDNLHIKKIFEKCFSRTWYWVIKKNRRRNNWRQNEVSINLWLPVPFFNYLYFNVRYIRYLISAWQYSNNPNKKCPELNGMVWIRAEKSKLKAFLGVCTITLFRSVPSILD